MGLYPIQGFKQKIFYLHVPIAIVALAGFIAAGVEGFRHLRSGDSRHDLNSYVFIHISVVFGVAVVVRVRVVCERARDAAASPETGYLLCAVRSHRSPSVRL